MGAIGLMGAMVSLLILLSTLPEPTALIEYATLRDVMAKISAWVLVPSLGLTLVAGLFSIAATKAFQNSGWAMIKLVTGIVMFEWTLIAIDGPMRREAELTAAVLAGTGNVAELGATIDRVWWSMWVLLAIATLNVVLGIWRPKLKRKNHFAKSKSEDASPAAPVPTLNPVPDQEPVSAKAS